MNIIPDLLMITWNRKDYVQRTLSNLLASSEDFRLYCWDNGSKDGAAELVASFKDERIVERHACPVNVMQGYPTQWFMERSKSSIVGKVDDDTLVPDGWIARIGNAVSECPELGMVGCWTFWPEDFERNKAHAEKKILTIGQHQILQSASIGGTAFLVRKELVQNYMITNGPGRGFPIDRLQMTRDGLISGWIYPLLWAEHMDDPRSEHCLMLRSDSLGENAALTARNRGHQSTEEYQQWIMSDADWHLRRSVFEQLRQRTTKTSPFLRALQKFWPR